MIQLKPILVDFLCCDVQNGESASFWHDSWTVLGPLFVYIGGTGPRQLRVKRDARVADATQNGAWIVPGARSERIHSFLLLLTTITPPTVARGADIYMWRKASGYFPPLFSSKETWKQLRNHSPQVSWSKAIWFKEAVPRHSFTAWLAIKGRLPSKDRLRSWGINVPETCVLCNSGLETHDHLFFECPFSAGIWLPFASRVRPAPPILLHTAATWTLLPQQPPNRATIILKLILQSATYLIWRERNSRIFTSNSLPIKVIQASLDRLIRDRLLYFSETFSSSPSLLELYFGCINFPFT